MSKLPPQSDVVTNPLQAYGRQLRSMNQVASGINRLNVTDTTPGQPNSHKIVGNPMGNRALKGS